MSWPAAIFGSVAVFCVSALLFVFIVLAIVGYMDKRIEREAAEALKKKGGSAS